MQQATLSLSHALSRSKRVELDVEEAENTMESDQARDIAVMTISSIVASEEIEEWKTA